LFNIRLFETNDYLTINIEDRDYHLSGFFHHLIAGCFVITYIAILIGESILLEERLRPLTVLSGRYGVEGDFRYFHGIFSLLFIAQ